MVSRIVLVLSRVPPRRGINCLGKGSAVAATDRADEGTISEKCV